MYIILTETLRSTRNIQQGSLMECLDIIVSRCPLHPMLSTTTGSAAIRNNFSSQLGTLNIYPLVRPPKRPLALNRGDLLIQGRTRSLRPVSRLFLIYHTGSERQNFPFIEIRTIRYFLDSRTLTGGHKVGQVNRAYLKAQ